MTLLPLHITAGVVGLASGAVALYARKGGVLHRKSGKVFVYATLAMSISGATIAALKSQTINVVAGLLTFYLVTTALLTVRDRPRWLDVCATVFGLGLALFSLGSGFAGAPSAGGFIFFGAVALLAVYGDLRLMRAGGIQGIHRIARHLWRMCFAMFVLTGSFFLGQSQVFPEPIRIVPLLATPVFLVIFLMIYWLVRVKIQQRDPLIPRP